MNQFTRNQTQNLVPFGLLPEDIQKEYCVEAKGRGMYGVYKETLGWCDAYKGGVFSGALAYRLKILPNELYYTMDSTGHECQLQGTLLGDLNTYQIIRPVKPEEVTKPQTKMDELSREYKITLETNHADCDGKQVASIRVFNLDKLLECDKEEMGYTPARFDGYLDDILELKVKDLIKTK